MGWCLGPVTWKSDWHHCCRGESFIAADPSRSWHSQMHWFEREYFSMHAEPVQNADTLNVLV